MVLSYSIATIANVGSEAFQPVINCINNHGAVIGSIVTSSTTGSSVGFVYQHAAISCRSRRSAALHSRPASTSQDGGAATSEGELFGAAHSRPSIAFKYQNGKVTTLQSFPSSLTWGCVFDQQQGSNRRYSGR